jgi:hypothetical protein
MQGGRVAPVKIGEITITDTGSLQSIFPPAAVETIVKYFPTVGAVPIPTIPPEDVPILVDAFKRRITALRSLTGKKVSTITDFKNNKAIREFIKVLAQLETTDSALHGEYRPLQSAKEPRRKLFAKLTPEIRRQLVFKILWDLFHPEVASNYEDTWNTFLEEIAKKSPIQIALENSKSMDPSGGKPIAATVDPIDMTGLTKEKEEDGRKAFTGAVGVSGSDQIKRLYAVVQLLNIDIAKLSPAHTAIIKKLESVLNVYSAYYATRFEKLIRTDAADPKKDGLIPKFYKANTPLITSVFDNITKLYTEIKDSIKKMQAPPYLLDTILKKNMCALIKLPVPFKTDQLEELITIYRTYVESAAKSATKNQEARAGGSDSNAYMLYNINTADPINIKILGKMQLTNLSSGLVLRKVTTADYEDSDLKIFNEEDTRKKIQEGLVNYFKDKNVVYLVVNNNRFATLDEGITSAIGHICRYEDGKLIDGVTDLPKVRPNLIPTKSFTTPSDTKCRDPIVKIEYKSTQMFKSVTPAILALLAVEHLKAQINPPAK